MNSNFDDILEILPINTEEHIRNNVCNDMFNIIDSFLGEYSVKDDNIVWGTPTKPCIGLDVFTSCNGRTYYQGQIIKITGKKRKILYVKDSFERETKYSHREKRNVFATIGGKEYHYFEWLRNKDGKAIEL